MRIYPKNDIYTIMEWLVKQSPTISFTESLDIFADSVENYKKAKKRQKLNCVAQAFIDACRVMAMDLLTGAQALEVFNNLATDLGTDKDTLENAINKLIRKQRKRK